MDMFSLRPWQLTIECQLLPITFKCRNSNNVELYIHRIVAFKIYMTNKNEHSEVALLTVYRDGHHVDSDLIQGTEDSNI